MQWQSTLLLLFLLLLLPLHQGLLKEGLGVYTYSSGARYEGEWRNNLKDGRGVYYYPKVSRNTACIIQTHTL